MLYCPLCYEELIEEYENYFTHKLTIDEYGSNRHAGLTLYPGIPCFSSGFVGKYTNFLSLTEVDLEYIRRKIG